jgi:hypothetical protein
VVPLVVTAKFAIVFRVNTMGNCRIAELSNDAQTMRQLRIVLTRKTIANFADDTHQRRLRILLTKSTMLDLSIQLPKTSYHTVK